MSMAIPVFWRKRQHDPPRRRMTDDQIVVALRTTELVRDVAEHLGVPVSALHAAPEGLARHTIEERTTDILHALEQEKKELR